MIRRLAGAAVLLFGAAAVATSSATASFTGAAAVGANAFSTGGSFGPECPATFPTALQVMMGFDAGAVSSFGMTAGFFGGLPGSLSVTADAPRSGAYSLRSAPAGTAGFGLFYLPSTSVTTARFALRLPTLPTTDVAQLFGITNGVDDGYAAFLGYRYNGGSPTLAVQLRNDVGALTAPVESTIKPVADQWYLVDVRLDASGSTHTFNWRIDGTDQPDATQPGTAGTTTSIGWIGTTVADTYTADFDDLLVSSSAADYPLPNATVEETESGQ